MDTAFNTSIAPQPFLAWTTFDFADQALTSGDDVAGEPADVLAAGVAASPEVAQPTSNMEERDRLVLEHLRLVKAIAVRVHQNVPPHVELDDLVHAGVLGLIDAATKFNIEKQVAFSTYAKHRIRGAILDSLRESDSASRDLRRRGKDIEAATRVLTAELKRTPSEAEIAERVGVDIDRFRQTMLNLSSLGDISANTRSTEHDDVPEREYAAGPETQPDHICAEEQRRRALDRAMTCLPDRYRKVLVLYYTKEMTMKEIGVVLGINESRVSQIRKAALEKLNVALQKTGITSSYAV